MTDPDAEIDDSVLQDAFDELEEQFREEQVGDSPEHPDSQNDEKECPQPEKAKLSVTQNEDPNELNDDELAKLQQTLEEMQTRMKEFDQSEELSEKFEAAWKDSNVESLMYELLKPCLSKELLYPAIKELHEKYPSWLEQQTLSEEERKHCTEQLSTIVQIRELYESPNYKDEDEGCLIKLAHLVSEMGQPPKELAALLCQNGIPIF